MQLPVWNTVALVGLTALGMIGTWDAAAASSAGVAGQNVSGEYVALAADCASCHTAPGGKPFAGGNALKSAFGTIYGPNITPDVETGIGSWTKQDFERALRLGVRKDGAYLYPAMPYGSYTKMTPADLDALWAYVHALPAVKNIVPKNELPFPLTIRSGMAVWQSLYFKPGPFVPQPSHDSVWNRGAYLVDALGHCGDCHTPRNIAQGLETQHRLTGAQIEGWYAPDISNDPLSTLSRWNTDELAHYLKTGRTAANVKAAGLMQEVVHDSLRHLTSQDLDAMAVYLKHQQGAAQAKAPTQPKLPRERLEAGRQGYEDNCSSCHQSDGQGIAGAVPALAGSAGVAASEPYNVIMAMLEGFDPQGSWGAMGSFAATLSDDQIADITNYVRTAWGNDALPNATPWSVSDWRKNAAAPRNEANALLCPSLPQEVMQPAFRLGFEAVKQAANDRRKMNALVGKYLSARPTTSTAEIIEALSTTYCRALAGDHLSQARIAGQIADFAQHVAVAVSDHKTAG